MRPVQEAGGTLLISLPQPRLKPGLLSVGQLADVLAQTNYNLTGVLTGSSTTTLSRPLMPYIRPAISAPAIAGLDLAADFQGFSDYGYPNEATPTGDRPYSYLNYLDLITPLVRLQDWATVKDHVFTIYMTQGDTKADPQVWTHTEMTVDRTRCLYTNDLPAIVTQTAPISYYNVVGDQK
jgi:hypothetical protein